MDSLFHGILILAHVFIGFYFAFLGFWNIYHWVPIMATMVQKGIPHPYLLLPLGIGIQIIAGTMIMFGILVKLAALLLIPSTIIAVSFFHPFWIYRGELRALNFTIFVANMTVTLGALFLLLVPINI